MFSVKTHRRRRAELARAMGHGVAVIPTSPERPRNRDTHYPYRFDSAFYYFTGFPEPEAVLVLVADGKKHRSLLFCRTRNEEREIWDGFRYGPERAKAAFGVDETLPIEELDAQLPKLLADRPALYFHLGSDSHWDERATGWLKRVREMRGVELVPEVRDITRLSDELRIHKDAEELETMRLAADIAADAHRRAMAATLPGRWEYEVEAELLYEFRRRGAHAPSYPPIVAGGANACVLHYVANDARLKKGDLLLIDAGCEVDGYASDITRTFPVSGRFSGPQRDLYQLVLAAQEAAFAKAKPGLSWNGMHDAAVKVLARGFVDLGLCQGSVDGVIESGDYKRFYMHRTGHLLGLDVHDVGRLQREGKWRKLEPGMTLTVEPGCYVRPGEGVPEAFWNIGIRIEDDVAITAKGREILTRHAPTAVAEIEAIVGKE